MRLLALLCALTSLPVAASYAEASSTGRAELLKAAYLFNFTKFVQWPNVDSDAALVVCFIGSSNVHQAFADTIEGKKLGNHPLTIRRLESTQTLHECHVLYLDADMASAGDLLLASEPIPAVLTVSDARGFAQQRGMIELFAENNRLRFRVNLQNTKRVGLHISSALLQLATSVSTADSR